MNDDYASNYSDEGFWTKTKGAFAQAGVTVLEPGLKLYYSGIDPATPAWAKTVVAGALGYFISPLDAIPDITPVVGYSDDLGVIVLAVSMIAAHIKPEHVARAKETLAGLFGLPVDR